MSCKIMSANNDSQSTVNGRLRPRKPSIALPPRSHSTRRSERRISDFKPKKFNTSDKEKVAQNKPDSPTLDFLCPYCDKKLTSKKSVTKHVGKSHVVEPNGIACQFCNHIENELADAMRHMIDAHPNQYYACLDCRTRFISSNDLKAHKLNQCRKLKPLGKKYRSKLRQSKEKASSSQQAKDALLSKDICHNPDGSDFNGIVISCELKPNNIEDPTDIEENIPTNVILPTNKHFVGHSESVRGPVIVLDEAQWNKRMASNFSFHNNEADQILSRLGVVHRSPRAADLPRSHTYKYIEDTTKFEKCFETVFYSKVASNVQENLEKFLDGSFNRTPLDPDSIIKTRKSKNLINTAEGFPILLSSEQFARNVFGTFLPRSIAPRHKWKRDSADSEKHIVSHDQLSRDSHANSCIVTLVSSLDIWTQLRMRRKFEDKYNNSSFNEKKTDKQNIISKELKEILESRELPVRATSELKFAQISLRDVGETEFPRALGLRPSTAEPTPPTPAVLSGEWVRPRCFVCCACGDHSRDPKALANHLNTQHPNAYVSHYDIAGELLCNDEKILKHLYVPSYQTPNRTRPLRGIRECTKCNKPISLEELHQHMLECAGDTPAVKRKCRNRPFGVRRRRTRMPENVLRNKIRRNIRNRKTRQKNSMRSRPRVKSEVGDAETIRKMIADLPPKRRRPSVSSLTTAAHRNRKRDFTYNKLLRNRQTLESARNVDKHQPSKDTKNSSKNDTRIKKKEVENNSKVVQSNPVTKRPLRVASRILRKRDLKRRNVLRRSPRSAIQSDETVNEITQSNKISKCTTSAVQTDEMSFHGTADRVDLNRMRGRTSEHAARSNSNSSTPNRTEQAGHSRTNANNGQPQQRPQIKHSIARLTATAETHDKAVQFHPHFLVNQECAKMAIKPFYLTQTQILYENDIAAPKLDKPPLESYSQKSPLDPCAYQRNRLNKPRKGLNDCIAMLKNKLEEPPSLNEYVMHENVQSEQPNMALCYPSLSNMGPMMLSEGQYVPMSIPVAHANTSAVSIISTPLDLSGKKPAYSSSQEYNEYETLDLSKKNVTNEYAMDQPDEDVVVDLCIKSVRADYHENTFDLSKRSTDQRPISMVKLPTPCDPYLNEPVATHDYQIRPPYIDAIPRTARSPSELHSVRTVSKTFDSNIELKSYSDTAISVYPSMREPETAVVTKTVKENQTSEDFEETLKSISNSDHNTSRQSMELKTTTLSTPTTSATICINETNATPTTHMVKNSEPNGNEKAKNVSVLPKEIVDILGKMPKDHMNQLLEVLPQYLGCNTSVKQLKLMVDLTQKVPMPVDVQASKSTSTEMANQTVYRLAESNSTVKQNSENKAVDIIEENSQKDTTNEKVVEVPQDLFKNDDNLHQKSTLQTDNSMTTGEYSGILTGKPKDTKEKTASSLRAVRIKTASQRRQTQNTIQMKQAEPLPLIQMPSLNAPVEIVEIQKAEVSSTQHNNLQRIPLPEIEKCNNENVVKIDNISITLDDPADAVPSKEFCNKINLSETSEHEFVKDSLPTESVAAVEKEVISEATEIASDVDSEDDISLAVIVQQKLAKIQDSDNSSKAKPQTDKKKLKKTGKCKKNPNQTAIDIQQTKTNYPNVEKQETNTVECQKQVDMSDNDKEVQKSKDFEQDNSTHTKSDRKTKTKKQQRETKVRKSHNENQDNFDKVQNKENSDEAVSNITHQVLDSENHTEHNKTDISINVNEEINAKFQQNDTKIEDKIIFDKFSKTNVRGKRHWKQKMVQFSNEEYEMQSNVEKPSIENQDNVNVNTKTTVTELKSPKNTNASPPPSSFNKCIEIEHNTNEEVNKNLQKGADSSETSILQENIAKSNLEQFTKALRRSRRGKLNSIELHSDIEKQDSPLEVTSNDISLSKDDSDLCNNEKHPTSEISECVEQKESFIAYENKEGEPIKNLKSYSNTVPDESKVKLENRLSKSKTKKNTRQQESVIADKTKEPSSLASNINNETKKIDNLESKKHILHDYKCSQDVKEKNKNQAKNTVLDIASAERPACESILDQQLEKFTQNSDLKRNSSSFGNEEVIPKKRKSKSVGERKSKAKQRKQNDEEIESRESDLILSSDIDKKEKHLAKINENDSTKTDLRPATCYDIPKAAKISRSKSTVTKTTRDDNYDPYDIDQEDKLLEQLEPMRKIITTYATFSDTIKTQKSKTFETSSPTKVDEINENEEINYSDDSSKSDIPLKMLVEEKTDRKKTKTAQALKKQEKLKDNQDSKGDAVTTSSAQAEKDSLKSEQFMESFGFFSERRPRKSNILAAKKISETFRYDDLHSRSSERTSRKMDRRKSLTNLVSEDLILDSTNHKNSKRSKKERKQKIAKEITICYCSLCEKSFRRPDNYSRHILTLFHISRLLQKEMDPDHVPLSQEPNCLIIYRHHLERIKKMTDKIKKRNKKLGIKTAPPKFELPSLAEIIAEANMQTNTDGQEVGRRGLSRDEALFLDCCELLKESHKTEPVEAQTLQEGEVSQRQDVLDPVSRIIAEDRTDCKSDGDVDSITAKTILESEEVRNLENDLLSGLKEAAAKRNLEIKNQMQSPNSLSLDQFDLDLETDPYLSRQDCQEIGDKTNSADAESKLSVSEELPRANDKPKKTKTKVTEPVDVDIYEDKFDKIKRKCRSQAAAAKNTQAISEPSSCSSNAKKKNEAKRGKKGVKQSNTIPTKGALKGFEYIKTVESLDNASSSEPEYDLTPPSKRKKRSSKGKKRQKRETHRPEKHGSNAFPRSTADIYEFMDNDDSDTLHFRAAMSREKFKAYKDTPSTSKADPMQQLYELSPSASDADDFVYMSDDYLCSANETENSVLSCELSSSGKVDESRKPCKRKEVIEKNAVMGKIFKNNAVRNEKISSNTKDPTKADKADLDQLFDSLLEDEPNSSMLKEDFPPLYKPLSPGIPIADASTVTTGSQSCDDSIFSSPRQETSKCKKNRGTKKNKQRKSKIHTLQPTEEVAYDKVKMHESREDAEGEYGVAQHRARRKCAVGKQNVLAESWSSESEADLPRPSVADTHSLSKKRSKKIKHGMRKSRHAPSKKYESEARSGAEDDKDSIEKVSKEPKGNKRERRGGGRSRSQIDYYFSPEEGEEELPQQHGWIVGNSHKKLVTMLAHAKGRKRDDKRSYIE